jgi:microcystin-dependent protein
MSSLLGGPGGTDPTDNRPLTDQEYQQLQRLLSDPLSFPLQFKAWLVSYLETSDLTLPMNSILGLQKTLGITGAGHGTLGIFPAGLILPYGGDTAPTGSVLCDGASYNRVTDARLFNAIGTKYGAVDGNTFQVPDYRGAAPVGKGLHSSVDTLGKTEGQPPGNRTPIHRTSDKGFQSQGVTVGSDTNVVGASGPNEQGIHHHGPDFGTPVDTPAFTVCNFIIVR